ncbi:OmpA family protein [Echinimonas agarilytica]|uniref:OmpA family protein n=2 Tax=Echinimonas agarilytica TaxID=1215918 RepID=A0AA41W9Z9_9GAMM|nr:OmpA family protein [Echinimonas agarilytica]
MAGTGVDVIRDGDRLILNIPNQVTFDVNRADVKPEFTSVLTRIASVVNHYPKTMIEVAGHTDSTGSASYNQTLSENRANSVKSYLGQQGTMYERINAIGFGESRPVADNNTAEGRANNRRVEIELVPIVQG